MFERYTEKARRVIFFARYEASEVGASQIEAEHLLLAVMREDKALVERFLHRASTFYVMLKGQLNALNEAGQRISHTIDLPLSESAKRVLAFAAEEAEHLGHRDIGSEHLLLGVLREAEAGSVMLLNESGLQISELRKALVHSRLDEAVKRISFSIDFPLSEPSKRVLAFAAEEAEGLGHWKISPEHLLLGVLREAEAGEVMLLNESGLQISELRKALADSRRNAE